ncbi:MAG: hypothetical protein JWQ44_2976 [Chthoniobacter sp.]|nr:hypothetical protein [Chthoniobacter sp.]
MMNPIYLITLLLGIAFSILFPIVICFHRKLVFAKWSKISSMMVCIAGLGWGFLGFVLLHSAISHTHNSRLEGIKGMLGGICIGLTVSILIAKPHEKRAA